MMKKSVKPMEMIKALHSFCLQKSRNARALGIGRAKAFYGNKKLGHINIQTMNLTKKCWIKSGSL